MKRTLLFIGLAWLIIIAAFVGYKEYTLRTGTDVILETEPVDPRDFFRGDYVILNYDISNLDGIPLDREFNVGDTAYVSLSLSNGVGAATMVSHEQPDGLFIKGTVVESWRSGLNIQYGIESYFVPERTGYAVEREPDLQVLVAIDKSGRSVIKYLILDGEKVRFDQIEPNNRVW